MKKFSANNHTVSDEEFNPIGVALFPSLALVNHSWSVPSSFTPVQTINLFC